MIKNGELLLDHGLYVVKKVFDKYPKAVDLPTSIDYAIGMFIRNLIVWALFRYTHPEDI
jgi:hypothetical protein